MVVPGPGRRLTARWPVPGGPCPVARARVAPGPDSPAPRTRAASGGSCWGPAAPPLSHAAGPARWMRRGPARRSWPAPARPGPGAPRSPGIRAPAEPALNPPGCWPVTIKSGRAPARYMRAQTSAHDPHALQAQITPEPLLAFPPTPALPHGGLRRSGRRRCAGCHRAAARPRPAPSATATRAAGHGHGRRVTVEPGMRPPGVRHQSHGCAGNVARACRRSHDGGWAHSAAIACQVHPAALRSAT